MNLETLRTFLLTKKYLILGGTVLILGTIFLAYNVQAPAKITEQKDQKPVHRLQGLTVHYTCDSGVSATVVYNNDNKDASEAEFISDKYATGKLVQVRSGSGVRYSNGEYVWWNKGNTGFLTIDDTDQTMLVNNCVEAVAN
jgi:membrane-bound inhibitor of C-type lysozyme